MIGRLVSIMREFGFDVFYEFESVFVLIIYGFIKQRCFHAYLPDLVLDGIRGFAE